MGCLFCRDHTGLFSLEGTGILRAHRFPLTHLPTLFLLIGYPVFWLEMAGGGGRDGVTSPAAWLLFAAAGLFLIAARRKEIPQILDRARADFQQAPRMVKVFTVLLLLSGAGILLCAGGAAFYPPHLVQEFDVINYHYTLPRQHLILGSFSRIPWASEDLYLLPLDFALAPFWMVTALPNQWPQFVFAVGILGLIVSLTRRLLQASPLAALAAAAAFLGTHAYGIQLGTAMLDLTLLYLFCAALDSLAARRAWLFAAEAGFLIWSKGFIPPQTLVLACGMTVLWMTLSRRGWSARWDFIQPIDAQARAALRAFVRSLILPLAAASVVIGGPFVAKSLYYAGTPLYPFAAGLVKIHPGIDEDSRAWRSLTAAADYSMQSIKNGYGYGRSPLAFILHPWRLAVPDEGVNNRFDYPVGLPFLLLVLPFTFFLVSALRDKIFPVLPVLAVLFWLTWWMGSQQTRFLYIPLLLIFLTTAPRLPRISPVLMGALLIAVGLNGLSVVRAHAADFGKGRWDVLRPTDKALVTLSREYLRQARRDSVILDEHDAAYARFPVTVLKEKLPHTVAF